MSKILTIRVYKIYGYSLFIEDYSFDQPLNVGNAPIFCFSYHDISIADFEFKKLSEMCRYSKNDLAKSVYEYGNVYGELQEKQRILEIEKRKIEDYNNLVNRILNDDDLNLNGNNL